MSETINNDVGFKVILEYKTIKQVLKMCSLLLNNTAKIEDLEHFLENLKKVSLNFVHDFNYMNTSELKNVSILLQDSIEDINSELNKFTIELENIKVLLNGLLNFKQQSLIENELENITTNS